MSIMTRIKALFFVSLLFGIITWGCIEAMNAIEPSITNSSHTEHVAGKVTGILQGMNFTFETTSGHIMRFQCSSKTCRATLGHLQRHISERAHTDVYYREGPNNTLLAYDVD